MSLRRRIGRRLTGPRLVAARMGLCQDPTFIIIGAQKGGTSSLYEYVIRHPEARRPQHKEMHYFDVHYDKGLDWYRSQFPLGLGARKHVTGEATPYYLFHPAVPARVASGLPEVRLVALLRNPVDRAYSHYQHTLRNHMAIASFEEALELEERVFATPDLGASLYDEEACHRHSYLARGRYVEQIRRWFDAVHRERVLILKSEDFYREPGKQLGAVLDFVGLRRWTPESFSTYNVGDYREKKMEPATVRSLRDYYRPYNEQLGELLGMDFSDWND